MGTNIRYDPRDHLTERCNADDEAGFRYHFVGGCPRVVCRCPDPSIRERPSIFTASFTGAAQGIRVIGVGDLAYFLGAAGDTDEATALTGDTAVQTGGRGLDQIRDVFSPIQSRNDLLNGGVGYLGVLGFGFGGFGKVRGNGGRFVAGQRHGGPVLEGHFDEGTVFSDHFFAMEDWVARLQDAGVAILVPRNDGADNGFNGRYDDFGHDDPLGYGTS